MLGTEGLSGFDDNFIYKLVYMNYIYSLDKIAGQLASKSFGWQPVPVKENSELKLDW